MKNIKIIALATGLASLAGAALISGCVVSPYGDVAVAAPAPAVTVAVGVPDDYVWDGYEYVGVIGGQYYYLGPGNVWIVCDPVRVARFHDYIGVHPDWHAHVIINERYRRDAGGHEHPWHENHSQDRNQGHGHNHDDEH